MSNLFTINPAGGFQGAVNNFFDSLYPDAVAGTSPIAQYDTYKTDRVPCTSLDFKLPNGDTAVLLINNSFAEKPSAPLPHLEGEFKQDLKNFMLATTGENYSDEAIEKLTVTDIKDAGKDKGVKFLGRAVRDNNFLNHYLDRGMTDRAQALVDAGFVIPNVLLHFLIERNNVSGVKGMLSRSPELINLTNDFGKTGLFFCRSRTMFDVLQEAGADLTVKDVDGNSPLGFYKNPETVPGYMTAEPELYEYTKPKFMAANKVDYGYVMRPTSTRLTVSYGGNPKPQPA